MELSPPAALSHRFILMIQSCPEHDFLLSVCVWQSLPNASWQRLLLLRPDCAVDSILNAARLQAARFGGPAHAGGHSSRQ